ncbi:siderophore-interacting protein [Microbacterium sp. zg-Y818]|uniref:siderophore-interacting protein n=1 Tax=unclassified Microbacterium TaxID=2609290 RepID=UPI00214B4882|nr:MULTISPECIES: siderophore-interacting protein [unclassified Microbacterium]MCR2799955.1 siderophore-interacting protein [Microbacterium sp. zg.Y818]WIM21933.1 siderophore-interacting protein [Microbacterium sp. zg-Y818]
MTTSTPVSSFRIGRQRLDLRFRTARLVARTWLTSTYVRIRLEGPDLIGFDSPGSDDHIRVFFPDAAPTSVEELRAAPNREYTPLAWDGDGGWLEIEFAVHDGGVAAQWAARAPLGSVAGVGGPRGSMLIEGTPGAWFLAGDETSVPAMRRFASTMDAAAVGRILVEVVDADHELPIDAPPGVVVEQLHRGTDVPGSALAGRLDALGADDRPAGDVFAFVAAEQAIVKPARALLQERWALPADTFVAKGYWKRGESEYHAPH